MTITKTLDERKYCRDTGDPLYLVNDVIKAPIIDEFLPVTDELESGLLQAPDLGKAHIEYDKPRLNMFVVMPTLP